MSDRREAVYQAAVQGIDYHLGLAHIIADAVETGLTWVPQFRCTTNSKFGQVCRMNENHLGTHRSADGEEW